MRESLRFVRLTYGPAGEDALFPLQFEFLSNVKKIFVDVDQRFTTFEKIEQVGKEMFGQILTVIVTLLILADLVETIELLQITQIIQFLERARGWYGSSEEEDERAM